MKCFVWNDYITWYQQNDNALSLLHFKLTGQIQCHSNPCQHDGTCTETIGGSFQCSCQHPYTGTTCEQTGMHHLS